MKTRTLVVALALLVCVTIGSGQSAFDDITKVELVTQKSDLIIRGKVIRKECRYGDNGRHIMTYITIGEVESLRGGTSASEIVIEMIGGRVGLSELQVVPSMKYPEGQEVVLFLLPKKTSTQQYFSVVPGGKYLIERSADGESGIVFNDTGFQRSTETKRRNPFTYDQFINILRSN